MNTTRSIKHSETHLLNTIGFISSISTAVVTLGTFIIAFFTPPISGPFAQGASVKYPYTDILSRFPRDYYWMYPAMLLMLIFIIFMVCVNGYVDKRGKIFSRIALLFACLGAGTIFMDYFIQVSVIQPSLINGELDGVSLLTQYNPHGIFIALEEAGYLFISIACLFLAPALTDSGRIPKAIRWIGILSFILAAASLAVISTIYGIGREYRFEVAVISIDFIVLILYGILWGILFKRADKVLTNKAKP
jgi:hypothetical protein